MQGHFHRKDQLKVTGKVEPDRIGRMHVRRRNQSITQKLNGRFKGFKGRPDNAPDKPGSNATGGRQRVLVKTHVARHRPGRIQGSITRHMRYLGRDGAGAEGEAGVFFDATKVGIDSKSVVTGWVEDRHHFRVIVSAERGSDLPDLTSYVREFMGRVQKDLGTELQWLGIHHFNTDNVHTHLVIRGKKPDGTDLVIPRAYISQGMAYTASVLATELLGERTVDQAREAKQKEVEATRFTYLDRMIGRLVERTAVAEAAGNPQPKTTSRSEEQSQPGQTQDADEPTFRRLVLPAKLPIGLDDDDRQLVLGRLAFLRTMDLVQPDQGGVWLVDTELESSLRALGDRHDIIRQLYASLGQESGRVLTHNPGTDLPVAGVVLDKGAADELTDDRYIVLRDADGKARYGRVQSDEVYQSVTIGSVAELGAKAHMRRMHVEEIVKVATGIDSGVGISNEVWTEANHRTYLNQQQPDLTMAQVDYRIQSSLGRLTFLARQNGSGVHPVPQAGTDVTSPQFAPQFTIEPEAFRAFNSRASRYTDVTSHTPEPVQALVTARAYTWLDRQTFAPAADARLTNHPAIVKVKKERSQWLIQEGYATASKESAGFKWKPSAINQLIENERAEADQKLVAQYKLPVTELPMGGMVTGELVAVQTLHRGQRMVIATEDKLFTAPVPRPPRQAVGSTLTIHRNHPRSTRVESAKAEKGRGQEQSKGTSRNAQT